MDNKDKKTGFIIINKPSGPTSFNIISRLRKITNIKKVGHAGTLDPFASGVLICAIGREATKRIKEFVGLDKEYVAELILGAETDTYDRTGEIQNSEYRARNPKIKNIEKTIRKFIGPQKQIPPMYSAVKREGRKLYEYAREGKTIERGFSEIEIYDIEIISDPLLISPLRQGGGQSVKIKVKCSSGTYIRSLAHDIGKELGCGAYLNELERTAIGNYKIEDAIEIEELKKKNWQKYLIKKQKKT